MKTYIAKQPDEIENQTWRKLITSQREMVYDYVCKEFLTGLKELEVSANSYSINYFYFAL